MTSRWLKVGRQLVSPLKKWGRWIIMHAERILSYIAIFVGTLALLMLPQKFTMLEPIRPILVYTVLVILILLTIWLIVVALRKPISPELKAIQELQSVIDAKEKARDAELVQSLKQAFKEALKEDREEERKERIRKAGDW